MTAPGLAATDDPTLLIPASLTALYDDAAELRRHAGELEEASADIASNDVATWLGDAAGQWGERRPALATQATVPAQVYRAAADVLEGHAQLIELARELVEIAIVLWVQGATAVSFAGLECEPLGSGLAAPTIGAAGRVGGAGPFGSGSSWTSPLARSLRQQAAATSTVGPGAELCAQAEQILADLRALVARSASAVAEFLDACCLDMPDGRLHPGAFIGGIGDWLYGMAVFCARFSTPRLYADGDAYLADAGEVLAGWEALMNQLVANPHDFNRLLLDSETYRDDPARWLGRLTPDAALAALGAPAAASRLARLTAGAARVLDNLEDAEDLVSGSRLADDVADAADDVDDLADDAREAADDAPAAPDPDDWREAFGDLTPGATRGVALVKSEQELRAFFDAATRGAEQLPSPKPTVPEVYRLEDGTRIQWRTESHTGGPTVDIAVPGERPRKIHVDVP